MTGVEVRHGELSTAPPGAFLKTESFFGSHFGAILVRFGAQLELKNRPTSPQDASKTVLGAVFSHLNSKTWIFTKYYDFPHENAFPGPKTRPQIGQDRPKTAPRRSWMRILSVSKIVLNLVSFWVRFGTNLGSQKGPLGPPFRDQNRPKFDRRSTRYRK